MNIKLNNKKNFENEEDTKFCERENKLYQTQVADSFKALLDSKILNNKPVMINSELDKNLLISTLSKVNKIAYDISVDTKDVLDRAKLFVDDKLNDFT